MAVEDHKTNKLMQTPHGLRNSVSSMGCTPMHCAAAAAAGEEAGCGRGAGGGGARSQHHCQPAGCAATVGSMLGCLACGHLRPACSPLLISQSPLLTDAASAPLKRCSVALGLLTRCWKLNQPNAAGRAASAWPAPA